MARFYTRAEQRAYRDKRQAQAKLIADRLMGKRKETLFSPGDDVGWQYKNSLGIKVKNPRSNFYIGGITT